MTSPAEHAATVREALQYVPERHAVLRESGKAALDALQAQAEKYENEHALLREADEHYEAAEAERDRLRGDVQFQYERRKGAEAECDRLAARVTELEAAP